MPHRIDTKLVHAGEPEPRIGGAASVPIFHSTVYEHAGGGRYSDIPYPRLSNLPNHKVLAGKLAALEGGEAATVTSSGMSAISTTLLAIAAGGHVLVQDCLYGGTQGLFATDLPELGISHDVIETDDPSSWAAKVRPDTRAIYVEAMTNPLVQVIDHRKVVELARAHDLVAIIDATFATPVNFRPLEIGYDVVVHSATKYLNGHSDLVAGAVIGSAALLERVAQRLGHLGGSLDPHACAMLYRGLRTLALRVRHQNASALAIARFLDGRPEVARVNYPGLESHPGHPLAAELFEGYGGLLSFELHGDQDTVDAFLAATTLVIVGPSLGGPETLMTQPSRTSHLTLSPQERARIGISDTLIRMAVGIEATEDLIADLGHALDAT